MGTDSSKILEDFFSGDRSVRFSRGGHSVLLPDELRKVVLWGRIPFEAFLNQGTVAEGTCWSLNEVTKTIEQIYGQALGRIRKEGLFSHVLPVLRYHKKLRRTGELPPQNIPRPDRDTQLKISRIIIYALHEVRNKERKLAGPLCKNAGNPKKRKANWDLHERTGICLTDCLYYVSVAPRFGLRAKLYKVPKHVIVGLSFGNRVHFLDPTRGENEVPTALIISNGLEYDYRNPRRMGYSGIVSAWKNKAYAFSLIAKDTKNMNRRMALFFEAINAIDTALEADPEDPTIWSQRADILHELTRFEKAEKSKLVNGARDAYAKTIALYYGRLSIDKRDAEAWKGIGGALYKLVGLEEQKNIDKRCAEAIEAYTKALELDDKDEEAWTNKGSLLLESGKIDGAEEAFDRLLKLNYRSASAWAGKGKIFLQRGIADKALKMIEWALKIDPKISHFWALKGEALEKLGRHEEAQKAKARAK